MKYRTRMKPGARTACSLTARCRTERGAERLRRLRSTAAELFLRCGYEGVSVDMLIDAVGGSRRNVYGHFGSKEGLFVDAVRSVGEEITQPLQALSLEGLGLREGLETYARALLGLLLQPRVLAMHRLMVAEGSRFPELARSMCEASRDSEVARLALWMAGRQQRGELCGQVDASLLANRFVDLIACGPQLHALIGQLPADWQPDGAERHVRTSVDLFLHGALAPPPGAPPARQPPPPD